MTDSNAINAARAEVLADLKQARANYVDALARCERVLLGANWVVRIGGFYALIEADSAGSIIKTQAAGLIGCSILAKRDAEEIARVIRNGNGQDRGEAVLYPNALRDEIAGLDKLIATLDKPVALAA